MARGGDIEWISIMLQVLFYGMISGMLVFFMSFFGFLGYRAGQGLVSMFFGSPSEASESSETNF